MSATVTTPIKISPDEVAARRDDDEFFILDVRNEDDYEEWPLKGSYNLPIYDELLEEDFSGLEAHLDELPKDQELVVVCVAGITSTRAATFLRQRGYTARVMTVGMNGWGRVHRTYDVDGIEGVTQIVRPGTGCISYLIADRDEALVIDPSYYTDEYRSLAKDHNVEITGVVDTYAHADHISGGRPLADELDVPYYLPETDSGELDEYTPLVDGEALTVGDRDLDIRTTPGHTPGSVSLRFDSALLTGDTVFVRSVGRPDLVESDEEAVRDAASDLFESLDQIADLSDDTLILPGHFSDEDIRPLTTTLFGVESNNDLFGMSDKDEFVETIMENLSESPANYQQIKRINRGKEPRTDDIADLELGPNNCAAN